VARERFVLALLAHVGVESVDEKTLLATTPSEADRLAAALAHHGLGLEDIERDPPFILAPGAGFGDAKCWPAEYFAALGDRLAQAGRRVLIVGAPGESDRVQAVGRGMRQSVPCLDGVLDVGALKALLSRARALVANDAGARHVAVAFGVPSVIFFGPTAVEKTAANLERVAVLERQEACRPCYRRTCPTDHRCLRGIGVDAAWNALQSVSAVPSEASPAREGPLAVGGAGAGRERRPEVPQ
jgi:heptosyltransferase-2